MYAANICVPNPQICTHIDKTKETILQVLGCVSEFILSIYFVPSKFDAIYIHWKHFPL